MSDRLSFIESDGGRRKAGFRGQASDCVVRAIAIATNIEYGKVYKDIQKLSGKSPRNGVEKKVYHSYLISLGWKWIPLMEIGGGCRVHMRKNELPKRKLILSLSKHMCAVIGGVIYDMYDCSREGNRCVYGYYIDPTEGLVEPTEGTLIVTEEFGVKTFYTLTYYRDEWCAKSHRNGMLFSLSVLDKLYGIQQIEKGSL